MIAFALQQRVGILLVGDPTGITKQDVGRVQNWRLRQWRRTHLVQALRDKAGLAGMVVRLVDERGTSSTCPACHHRVAKPTGSRFGCPHCNFHGHRCRQHRRQGWRRTHPRWVADAGRAPPRRHPVGAA